MAITIVLINIGGSLTEILVDEFGHSGRHALRNVHDDTPRLVAELGKDTVALVEFLEQSFLVRFSDSVHRPRGVGEGRLVEVQEVLDLHVVAGEGRHVVLDRVQGSEDEVKDENIDQHGGRQLADHGSKTAGHFAEDFVTERQVIGVKSFTDEGCVEVGFQGLDVQKHARGENFVEVRQLFEFGFLVGLDFSVGTLFLASITSGFGSKERTGLATPTKVFIGRIEAVNAFQIDVLVGGHGFVEVLPPVIQEPLLADETEPRREEQGFVLHHFD
mmetsp:Transcript_13501/g.37958  ORF Transcript_13501/g.37958 Transcript_13501/m.37958 type:complete len:273 (+) Transcript_13501:2136-2954(+)